MPEPIILRPEVRWFAEQMERRLRANDHKGGWLGDQLHTLFDRLKEETSELEQELWKLADEHYGHQAVVKEAADVANFAMMVATNAESCPRCAPLRPVTEETTLPAVNYWFVRPEGTNG